MDVSTFNTHRQTLTTPTGEIAYTELGSGPVALFVHGIGTSGALWRHVIEQASDTSRCIAVDLPAHGASAARDDMSAAGLAQALAELCGGLGLDQVDLVGNDTGGAVAQIFAAGHPDGIRSLTLTNCDCEGNFPPPSFLPIVEQARQGNVAAQLSAIFADPTIWSTPNNPLSVGYEHPERVPEETWRAYFTGIAETSERTRGFERLVASLDASDLEAVGPALRTLNAPTLLVWGTGDEGFGIKWAYFLRDLIPGAQEVVEVDGAKFLFPEERPADLVPHLRRHWGR
jgi:pimeloyl-ACP methyl ester carboxylesterase